MRILVTNDDGIHAPGLAVLEAIAAQLSQDVWVVAPETEQSGVGHALTLTQPLRLRQLTERRFAVTGTPTDCVMLALGDIMATAQPDLILSGVNRGANLAEDVTYSGTISAAMEGTLAGVRSIALSQAIRDWPGTDASFACAAAHGVDVVRRLVGHSWAAGVLMNVNFPPVAPADVQGVRVTTQGQRTLGQFSIDKRTDSRGFPYFWLGLGREYDGAGTHCDLAAVRAGCISVTPLHLDLTHRESLAALARVF